MPAKPSLRKNILYAVVFMTGAAILIIEIVATRILSPYFGTTIFTVSSVIGIILAALSCGYYLGGRLADRKPIPSCFYGIILLGGITVFVIKLLVTFTLPSLGYKLSMISGPLLVSMLLFFLPAMLLGTLSPYAIKLQHVNFPKEGIGRVSGNIFFWSTLGSIFGSLSAGFLLIPFFGVDRILISIAYGLIVLGTTGLLLTGRRKIATAILALGITGLFSLIFANIKSHSSPAIIFKQDGIYERITIRDHMHQNRPIRLLYQDLTSSSAEYLDTGNLFFDYTKYYSLYDIFTHHPQRVLVIGGGAYSIPKKLLQELPHTLIDVAEIEPKLYELGRQFFQLPDDPRLQNHTEDGRRFLHDTPHTYDLIFSDVYYSFASVPMHCTTKEFFQLGRNKLNEGGIFLGNFVGSLDTEAPSLIFSVIKTFRSVFPNSFVFANRDPNSKILQNFVILGHNSNKRIDLRQEAILNHPNPIIRNLSNQQVPLDQFDLSPYTLLTDNYAPIEYLSAQVIRDYNASLRPQHTKMLQTP